MVVLRFLDIFIPRNGIIGLWKIYTEDNVTYKIVVHSKTILDLNRISRSEAAAEKLSQVLLHIFLKSSPDQLFCTSNI